MILMIMLNIMTVMNVFGSANCPDGRLWRRTPTTRGNARLLDGSRAVPGEDRVELLPGMFGRMILLAQEMGYAAQTYSPQSDETGKSDFALLQATQVEVFLGWLCMSLEEHVDDLVRYFQISGGGLNGIQRVIRHRTYRDLLPGNAEATHQQHFLLDMEIALASALNRLRERFVEGA